MTDISTISDSDLFYVDTVGSKNDINFDNFNSELIQCVICKNTADKIVQILKPFDSHYKKRTNSLDVEKDCGIVLASKKLKNKYVFTCDARFNHNICHRDKCTSMLNQAPNYFKHQGNIKLHHKKIYFCSIKCASEMKYNLSEMKICMPITFPKACGVIISSLKKDFCCKYHIDKFYKSVYYIYLCSKKNVQQNHKSIALIWDELKPLILKLNILPEFKTLIEN